MSINLSLTINIINLILANYSYKIYNENFAEQIKNPFDLIITSIFPLLYENFGYGIWSIIILFFITGLTFTIGKIKISSLFYLIIGEIWSLISISSLLEVLNNITIKIYKKKIFYGGIIGNTIISILTNTIGLLETIILLITCLISGLIFIYWPIQHQQKVIKKLENKKNTTKKKLLYLTSLSPSSSPDTYKHNIQNINKRNTSLSPKISLSTSNIKNSTIITNNKLIRPYYYSLPSLELLKPPPLNATTSKKKFLHSTLIENKLKEFGIKGNITNINPGPIFTTYEFKPSPGIKINKITGLDLDLAIHLNIKNIRITSSLPNKAAIGIEIPNNIRETIYLREILDNNYYQQATSPITIALGKDILGNPAIYDLADMPHLLIAGATGTGKSMTINSLILSILFRANPKQARLIMIDPKRIEFSIYNKIPHLICPTISSPKKAISILKWTLKEMERRYVIFSNASVRNINSYNDKLKLNQQKLNPKINNKIYKKYTKFTNQTKFSPPDLIPYIVIIIDELADLMILSSKKIENLITRLAQMARAAGIHLVIATQRPSVDIITGLIKANIPARISFKMSSKIDSRIILDTQGAELLLNSGDMLFLSPKNKEIKRLHGAYISEEEIESVVNAIIK